MCCAFSNCHIRRSDGRFCERVQENGLVMSSVNFFPFAAVKPKNKVNILNVHVINRLTRRWLMNQLLICTKHSAFKFEIVCRLDEYKISLILPLELLFMYDNTSEVSYFVVATTMWYALGWQGRMKYIILHAKMQIVLWSYKLGNRMLVTLLRVYWWIQSVYVVHGAGRMV